MSFDTQALILSLKLALCTLLFLIPFGIYVGYFHAKKELKKNQFNYNFSLLVIPPNGIENYTKFVYCSIYCLICLLISIWIGIIIHFLFFL